MDLGLASLENSQLWELLHELLIVIRTRHMDGYMIEASQSLIQNQGKLLQEAKLEFYAQIEAEKVRQEQEVLSMVRTRFATWIKEQVVLPPDFKKQITDAEYDKLMDQEIKLQVQNLRSYVATNFQSLIPMEEPSTLTDTEIMILATDAAKTALTKIRDQERERRKQVEKEAAYNQSARKHLNEIAKQLGNTLTERMELKVGKVSGVSGMVVTSAVISRSNTMEHPFAPDKILWIPYCWYNPQQRPDQPISIRDGYTVAAPKEYIRKAIEDYITNCGDSNKLVEMIPPYQKDLGKEKKPTLQASTDLEGICLLCTHLMSSHNSNGDCRTIGCTCRNVFSTSQVGTCTCGHTASTHSGGGQCTKCNCGLYFDGTLPQSNKPRTSAPTSGFGWCQCSHSRIAHGRASLHCQIIGCLCTYYSEQWP